MKRTSLKGSCILGLSLLAVAAAARAGTSPYEIQLLSGSFTPPAGVPALAQRALTQRVAALAAAGRERIHLLVQLDALPDEAEKNALWQGGLDLGAYVPGNAFIAAVPVSEVAALANRRGVRWFTHWDASFKVHPRLLEGKVAPWALDPERPGWVMLFVQLHHDVAIDRIDGVSEKVGGVVMPPVEGLHGATVWVPAGSLAALAESEDVLWFEEGPPPLTPTNDGVRDQMKIDEVNAAPYSLDGTGVRVFVFDGGAIRATHETFNAGAGSRVTLIDGTATSSHSTHVAGTVGGDGAPSSSGGRGRGAATGVTFLSAGYQQSGGTMLFWDNAGDVQADYALARNTHNADFGTNSIGSNTASNGYPCSREGDYGVTSNMLDGIVRGNNPTVGSTVAMTWANGNERTGGSPKGRCGSNYLTTAPPSCAKNPIHVGALNSDGGSMTTFSSWGPCDDGRLKPVISAPGCESGRVTGETAVYSSTSTSNTSYGLSCGTSMSTPAVAGTVALFIEDWRARGFGGANDRPLPALLKAMLVHSARDLGQDGPDFIYGYGAVDAQGLIDTLRAGTGSLGAAGPTVWGTDSVSQGATDSFTFTVPSGTAELKATLAWDDAAAAAFAASAPVNNLNLELVAPNSTVFRPFVLSAANPHLPATTGTNNLDNQEQVLVENPQAGAWTVRVVGTSVPSGPQSYALAYTAKAPTHAAASCTTSSWGYETGNDGWTLSGAARVAAPATGHGSWSLRLGGAVSSTHEATRDVAVPSGSGRAEWTFWWYMTTNETASSGFSWDFFYAEVRNTSGAVLAAFDLRSDAWRQATWMEQRNIDLTPWAGQTVRLAFRATNDSSLTTSFWVDDVALATCPATGGGGTPVTVTFTSVGADDGRIVESSETSGVGGTVTASSSNSSALRVGDTSADAQYRSFVSFDTSSIPDGATVTAATLRIRRGTSSGTNPFTTHGSCLADVVTGFFGTGASLVASDFQAVATATGVATMSNPTSNGTFSEGNLSSAGLAAVNKTGKTQLRVYLSLDDNDDLGNDYIGFYSGENATAANRPQLVVTYQP